MKSLALLLTINGLVPTYGKNCIVLFKPSRSIIVVARLEIPPPPN